MSEETKKELSERERSLRTALESLADLAGGRVTDDNLVFEGKRFIIPETMKVKDAIQFLYEWQEANEEETEFTRTFDFRPWDGAAAVNRALKKVFGNAGIGKATYSFFGKNPPQMISIADGVDSTLQVPWGALTIPTLEATTLYLGSTRSEMGPLFQVQVQTKKKYQKIIEGLFVVISEELRERSIYKGKAFDGRTQPEFIDVDSVDPDKVVYAEDTLQQLEANLWSVVRHADKMEELGIPLKRAVLFEGPYGTGKTLAGFLTAKIAVENGWTFVYGRPGRDKLRDVMATAQLYQPAVVYMEDVDTIATGDETDRDKVSELLDIFDGIQAKGTRLIVVMTTNHVEKIHKGMVRPGRLDAVIHVGALDREGIEKLTKAVVEPRLLANDINFDAVYESMDGFMPAFAKEAIDRAVRYAVARTGQTEFTLSTADLVGAAHGLRPQLELMESAKEGGDVDPLTTGMERVIKGIVHETDVDINGDLYPLMARNNR